MQQRCRRHTATPPTPFSFSLSFRDALRSDLSQYGQKPVSRAVDRSQRDAIRALVEDISERSGADDIRLPEFEARRRCNTFACDAQTLASVSDASGGSAFRRAVADQMMCARMPRICAPAQYLFRVMARFSREPLRVTRAIGKDALMVRCAWQCA